MSTQPPTIPPAADDPGHRFAVVTGGSSGIGRALAREFARGGFDVLVAAEDDAVHEVPAELAGTGRHAEAVRTDLATREGVDALYGRIAAIGRPVDAIALNAGFGVGGGSFLQTALEDHLRLIDLNVHGTVHLARHVAADMVRRGEGRMLFTSSLAAEMPGPYYATYAASKAFVQSFAEALRVELADAGVTVTALQPGPTDTEFFAASDMEGTTVDEGPKDDPDDVARKGFQALMNGDDHVVTGLRNKVQAAVAGVLPDPLAAKLHAKQAEPKD